MRASSFIILILVAAAVVWGSIQVLHSALAALAEAEANAHPSVEHARASTVYLLSENEWMSFRIPPDQTTLKVISNANVAGEHYGAKDFNCTYFIHYQLLDREGRVLRDHAYSLTSGFLIFFDQATGAPIPAHFYRTSTLAPLGSRLAMINVEGGATAATRLNLRLAGADSQVEDVSVRVYHNEKPQAYKLRYLWQRLSLLKKERLARSNIYTLDLLSDDEKRNLLENRWSALAPLGNSGRDYGERKLITVNREDSSAETETILPYGVYADSRLLGVIPLPEGGGCVRLELEILEPNRTAAGPSMAYVTWFGEEEQSRMDSNIELQGTVTVYERDYEGGYLEVHSPERLVARGFVASAWGPISVTPEPGSIPAYILRREAPLEFAMTNHRIGHTALRIDARRLIPEGAPEGPTEVRFRYQLLDDQGKIVEEAYSAQSAPISLYDSVLGAFTDHRVTDPVRRYFWFAPGRALLRFFTDDENVIVTVYTRPDALPRNVRVPEDYLAREKGEDAFRTWFVVRPDNYAEALKNQSETLLRLQARPPSTSEDYLTGNYASTACDPDGNVQSLKVLTPVVDDEGTEEDFSPSRFAMLETGTPHDLLLEGRRGETMVEPRLICLKETDDVLLLTVLLDGEVHLRESLASRSSEIALPRIPAGWHAITILSNEPVRVYLNRVREPRYASSFQRIVHALGPKGLTFLVEKETEGRESLLLRLLETEASDKRTRVQVSLGNVQRLESMPMESWTFLRTTYDLRTSGKTRWPVLSADMPPLRGGDPFYFTLGADLKPGVYHVSIHLEDGPPSYLHAVKVAPGRKDPRQFFLEKDPLRGGEVDE